MKKKSNFLLGLVMKSLLLRESLDSSYINFNGKIEDEFKFFTRDELLKSLKTGCSLFKHILFINRLIQNKPKTLEESFKKGKEFLIDKLKKLKLDELVKELESD